MHASSPLEHRKRGVENRRAESDVLAALRRATSDRHRTVDDTMPLSRPGAALSDYLEHLAILRTWLNPLESWLQGFGRGFFEQTKHIEADLAEAGLSWDRKDPRAIEQFWPMHATPAFRWGARYVVEGSRLGASFLYQRLGDSLHPHRLLFLQRAHEESAQQWPAFLHDLRAGVRRDVEIDAACAGACASFDALLALCDSRNRA